MYKLSYLLIIAFSFLGTNVLLAQGSDDCECEDEVITLCFLSDEAFCNNGNNNAGGCGYSLDGDNMDNGLARKLTNTNNFGPNGTVSCLIDLVPLRELPSIQFIQDQQCDVIFTGNFIVNPSTGIPSGDFTSVPDDILNRIRDWSQLCETNLVITTQKEALPWGYDIQGINQNPNVASTETVDFSIFGGPFGVVNQFNQGGAYQGVIVNEPESGTTTLAIDANGRPTVVLDNLTNDIILGDIGVFCGGGAGDVSNGANVNNSNDRFVCNIFALGCSIASSVPSSISSFALCPGEEFIRPNGEIVTSAGQYIDTLQASNLCDSIIISNLSIRDTIRTDISYIGCADDGFNIVANDIMYDQSNPEGQELIKTSQGCDSLITVSLRFNELTTFEINESFCTNEPFSVTVGTTVFDASNLTGVVALTNAEGCDSTVTVMLEEIPLDEGFQTFEICQEDTIMIDDQPYMINSSGQLVIPRSGQCDSLFNFEVVSFSDINVPDVPSSIDVDFNDPYDFTVDLQTGYRLEWTPAEAFSCDDCPATQFLSNIDLTQIQLTIYDENDCSIFRNIDVEYSCPVYIPNAISINGNVTNQNFQIFTPCTLDTYEMTVFDRWGSEVFHSENSNLNWDGKYNGDYVENGVYVYLIKLNAFQKEQVFSGGLTVLR